MNCDSTLQRLCFARIDFQKACQKVILLEHLQLHLSWALVWRPPFAADSEWNSNYLPQIQFVCFKSLSLPKEQNQIKYVKEAPVCSDMKSGRPSILRNLTLLGVKSLLSWGVDPILPKSQLGVGLRIPLSENMFGFLQMMQMCRWCKGLELFATTLEDIRSTFTQWFLTVPHLAHLVTWVPKLGNPPEPCHVELLLLQHVAHLLGPGDHLVTGRPKAESGSGSGNPLEIHWKSIQMWMGWRNMEKYGEIWWDMVGLDLAVSNHWINLFEVLLVELWHTANFTKSLSEWSQRNTT